MRGASRWRALACAGLASLAALPARAQPPASPLLEPGAIAVVERRPGRWSEEGVLGWLPAPAVPPERWRASGAGVEVEALSVPGHGPLLVFLPYLDGGPWLAEAVVRGWAREGHPALALLPPGLALQPGASLHDWARLLEERVRAGRAVLRLARRELAPACVVLVGMSLGAMAAVPVAALEPPVDAVVLLLAGGGIEAMAEASALPGLQASMRGQAVTPALRAKLVAVDPLGFAAALDPARVLFVRARWDRVVPPSASEALWQALGRPTVTSYPAGHRSFVLFLPLALREAQRLAAERCGS